MSAREKIPDIFRQFRSNPEMRDLPREERGRVIQAEFEVLRAEAQKDLEEYVPAADAKTIIEESLRGMGFPGRGPFGSPRR
jgi:hypothetical protein